MLLTPFLTKIQYAWKIYIFQHCLQRIIRSLQIQNQKFVLKKYLPYLLKTVKILLTAFILFVTLIFTIPFLFQEQVNSKIKEIINEQIDGELNYSKIRLSFFDHFPALTASLDQISLKGSAPFKNTELLQAKQVSLGIDMMSLFKSKIVIKQFFVDDGTLHVQVNKNGESNYNIIKKTPNNNSNNNQSNTVNLAFKSIILQKVNVLYEDLSIPIILEAKQLNYEGRGDLMSSLFDLDSKAHIESLSLTFDGEKYVDDKMINANLMTKVNTNTLAFVFERNDIRINKLPVKFKGEFGFLKNGYHLDFKLKSSKSTLSELLSLVPSSYSQWLRETTIKGDSELFVDLGGDYIVEQNKMPNLTIGLIISDGYFSNNKAKIPIENLQTNLKISLPQLNPDSLLIDLRQFEFKIASGYFNTIGNVKGLNPLTVNTEIKSNLDLEALNKALALPSIDFRGKWTMNGKINGTYATAIKTTGLRHKKDTIIASIPNFNIQNTLREGYFKLTDLPAAIERIEYDLTANCQDAQIQHAKIALDNINIKALNNYIKGFLHINDLLKLGVTSNLQANIQLADIKKVYPIDSLKIAGDIFVNMVVDGAMDLKKGTFPETNTTITLKNGFLKTLNYPLPLEEVNVETYISSQKGTLKDLQIKILPISFTLAGEPFFVNADFKNFKNIHYKIKSKGKLNLEPLYKIFAIDGVNINGYISTNLDLAGLQSDALSGNYNKLKNHGTIDIGHIQLESELFPKPFYIKKGHFSFAQEKLIFENINSSYGLNTLNVTGYLDNLIHYFTNTTDVLKGNFQLNSPQVNINDFTFFANIEEGASTSTNSGVILLPKNLDLSITGDIHKTKYDQLTLNQLTSQIMIHKGNLSFTNTGFELAGLKVNMHGQYKPLNINKAQFNYGIKADSFDIQRAYNEIPMFKKMVSSAKNAHGIISLDYQLSGILDKNMSPIMPSITGKGTLTLEQIKFMGFKLLNSISKETSKESLADASVKKVKINTSIANNVMTISRTKMKMALFRPRFEGQVTLDGKMNLGFRLGLPPFGIFGVPLRIIGNAQNPIIKLGKYKEDDLDTEMDSDDKKLYQETLVQDSIRTSHNQKMDL